jgi:hypothetical protein
MRVKMYTILYTKGHSALSTQPILTYHNNKRVFILFCELLTATSSGELLRLPFSKSLSYLYVTHECAGLIGVPCTSLSFFEVHRSAECYS